MQIERVTTQSIKKAVEILRRGGTVIYPTETAYALGADAANKKAIAKIFKIKNRPKEKGLPVICYSKKQVEEFFEMPEAAWRLWLKFYPKPLSIILEIKSPIAPSPSRSFRAGGLFQRGKSKKLLPLKKGGREGFEIPVRVSSNKIARALSRGLRYPIISTSANVSGKKTLYDIKEIIREFANKKYQPDLILDGGKLPRRKPSTIVKIVPNVKSLALNIEVVRQGKVKISN